MKREMYLRKILAWKNDRRRKPLILEDALTERFVRASMLPHIVQTTPWTPPLLATSATSRSTP